MSDRYILNKCEDIVFDTHSNQEVLAPDCAILLNGLLVRIVDLDWQYRELMKRRREVRALKDFMERMILETNWYDQKDLIIETKKCLEKINTME